ncbi:MAG: histidine kinase N-terminal 7TM domain-containing protein [Rariglobus sp.]
MIPPPPSSSSERVPWQITALFFSCVFELAMLFLVRGRLRTSTAGPFSLALLLNALWCLGYAIELSLPALAEKEFIFQVRCSFLCFYAAAWLETIHRMTRSRPLLRGWTLAAVLIVPAITLVLLWVPGPGQNPFLRHDFWVDDRGGLGVLRNTLGPWGHVYYIFNYAIWCYVFFLLYPRRKQTAWERRGRLLILASAVIGWTVDVLHLFGLTSPAGLNYAPILFPLTSALMAVALLRHRMFDLAPVARAALIERLDDRIIVLDDEDRVIDHNQIAATTFNFKSIRSEGRRAAELLHAWPGLVALLDCRDNQRAEVVVDGLTFEAVISSVLHDDGTRTGARVLILRNISIRKGVETQLRAARDMAEAAGQAQARFLATMSHEIRTPMNGVIGFTQLLKETPLTPAQNEYLDLIDHSSRSLLVIINDVLDYSKIAADQLEIEQVRCDLHVIVDQTVRLLDHTAREKGITLAARFAVNVPSSVISDPVRISQVLNNLVGNAIKFTSVGGVTLDVEAPGPDLIAFKITDTGIGIAPENQARIFTPFSQADASTTRRFGGTGLGLSITRRLCELMGGCLTLSSTFGQGSVFTAAIRVRFVSEITDHQSATPDISFSTNEATLNLLVCEDNSVNQAVIRAFLTRLGHQVTLVDDGAKGLAALDRQRFDAVLMDLEMPVIDGYEAVRRIRASEQTGGPRTYIIALTAHALKGERERCLALGMDDFLTKPVNMPALKAALHQVPASGM